MTEELRHIRLSEFEDKVADYAKTNLVLKNIFSHPRSKIKRWQDLPEHLIQDLFKKLGCKPFFREYNSMTKIPEIEN